ncbi:hypothetical protein EAI_14394, partial [Harpegnathos saltator]
KLNGKHCSFKIDTGSDVSVINGKFVETSEKSEMESYVDLVYPTGEKVPVRSQVFVKVELGKFSLKMSMFIVEIADDCLLEIDFLTRTNAESSIREALGIS